VFSRRTRIEARKNALAVALAKHPPRFDLAQGNPTHTALPYDAGAVVRALANPAADRYDPDPRGLPHARAAVAALFAERGVTVDATSVFLCAGTSEAYGFLFKLLCDPGDEVLIPEPSYEWHAGTSELRAAVTARTRAILVVSPNNPTGSYLKRSELSALEETGLPIISDEVFADYPLREDPERVGSALESTRSLVFSLGGLSKHAGLPQWKVAWIAMRGPADAVAEASARLELVADTYLSVATPTQYALPELLRLSSTVRTAIRARLRRNWAALRAAVAASPALTLLDVEGGFYATLRLPRTRSEEAWVLELLERDSVHVQPGFFFDFPQEAYVVLSLLTDETVFDPGLERLVRRVELDA
jgi:alanine-synthesizing transaminase